MLSSYAYTYDSNGNILTVNESVGEAQNSTTYTYDKLNRIASVAGTKGVDSYYEYDARGNRKANFEQVDFLSEEDAEFRYNEEDKLYYSEVGEESTTILYSANGYRYLKQENTKYPEFYVYDTNGRLQAIARPVTLSASDGSTRTVMYPIIQYIWGPDRVLAKIDKMTNKSYYYLYNGHGDVVQIVDTSGAIKNTYDYDVWGNFITKQETIDNHFTYFGQTYDETTGLYYLRARYYDPTTGRFTQQDPAEDGYNWYIYGNQNPVMFLDFDGLNAIVANQLKNIGGAGHMSSFVQDKNNDWYFFYWGNNSVSLTKVDDASILNDEEKINEWLEDKNLSDGKYKYDGFCYILGDFSATKDYYQDLIDQYESDIANEDYGWFDFKNKNYNLVTRNCAQETMKGLYLGKIGTNGERTVKQIHNKSGYIIAVLPNANLYNLQKVYGSKSLNWWE